MCKNQGACQLCWALTFASSWFCSLKLFYKSLFTVHCQAEDLFCRPTDSSLLFSSPELWWSLKRLQWGGGESGTYGKTWASELDLGGLAAVFPSQNLCWSNNSYTRVAIPILSTAFLHHRNHLLHPCVLGGTVKHDIHSPGRGSRDPRWPVEPQPFGDIILERGMWPKQDHSDSSLGLACAFWERDALVLPDWVGQEEVSLSCG